MSSEALLATGAAAAGVLGAWELAAAVERTAVADAVGRLLAPMRAASREGREPTDRERLRLALVGTAALVSVGWLLSGPRAALLTATAGPAMVAGLLRSRRRRWRSRLAEQAPEVARALADALAAGRSVRTAIGEAAATATGPAALELARASARLDLGEPTGRVLDALRRRAGSPPWDTLVAAILLQRDTGGDLAGLLRDLAADLEHARRLRREAEGATAQSRFSARLVLAMPVGAAMLAEVGSPGFAAGLLRTPMTAFLVGAAAVLQLLAALAIRRLARVAA